MVALQFGPTANLNATALAALVAGLYESPAALDSWAHLRSEMNASDGALHLRLMSMRALSPHQQRGLAASSRRAGFQVSVEGGGALCGVGTGEASARQHLAALEPFTADGGLLSRWLLESVFSRTAAGCPHQSEAVTAGELAAYAATVAAGLHPSPPHFWLYDALPHYAVGRAWPKNADAGAVYTMELGATLRALKAAMGKRGVALRGYWADW